MIIFNFISLIQFTILNIQSKDFIDRLDTLLFTSTELLIANSARFGYGYISGISIFAITVSMCWKIRIISFGLEQVVDPTKICANLMLFRVLLYTLLLALIEFGISVADYSIIVFIGIALGLIYIYLE